MPVPSFGSNSQWDAMGVLLRDSLQGQGDYLTQQVGSLAWIEARVIAQMFQTAFNYLQLMSNQIQPASSSIYLPRWANVYNLQGLSNIEQILSTIGLIQSLTGTPPNYDNVNYILQQLLGQIYVGFVSGQTGLVSNPENQYLATYDPFLQVITEGNQYAMPLAELYVYVWQPRDNEDNKLITDLQFNSLVTSSYQQILNNWLPHYTEIITMNLQYSGNGNSGDYATGYNVVSGSATSTTLTGVNTTFTKDFFPQAAHNTLPFSIMRTPPIQIVDDAGKLQTYFVSLVNSDTSITLTSPIVNNITSRTYRTLGWCLDLEPPLNGGILFAV